MGTAHNRKELIVIAESRLSALMNASQAKICYLSEDRQTMIHYDSEGNE
jgi:hypothetical protein